MKHNHKTHTHSQFYLISAPPNIGKGQTYPQPAFPAILPKILGNCQKNSSVQQTAAVASDTASAAYTPVTPMKRGSISASGINKITLRSKAMKIEILACPSATNIFWQARCNPKIVMPARNTGIVRRTVSISLASPVKADATTVGQKIMNSIRTRLKENMVTSAMRKHSFTRCLSPCP